MRKTCSDSLSSRCSFAGSLACYSVHDAAVVNVKNLTATVHGAPFESEWQNPSANAANCKPAVTKITLPPSKNQIRRHCLKPQHMPSLHTPASVATVLSSSTAQSWIPETSMRAFRPHPMNLWPYTARALQRCYSRHVRKPANLSKRPFYFQEARASRGAGFLLRSMSASGRRRIFAQEMG